MQTLRDMDDAFPRRALLIAGLGAVGLLAFVLIWQAADVLLLVFAGVIIALFLRGIADWLAAHTSLPPALAVGAVVIALIAVVAGAGWLLADNVAAQLDQLGQRLPSALQQLRERMARYAWGRFALERIPDVESLTSQAILIKATGALSTTLGTALGALANIVIVAFVALYIAFDPRVYKRGLVRLAPIARRDRAREVLDALGTALRRWFAGRLVGMAVIGVLTGTGLWLIGIPLALALGLLAGVLNFVPYIGPLLSFVPAIVLALLESPGTAVWVLGLYLAVQTIESYLVTPLVAQRSVSLPPALTVTAQVVLGVLLGWLGLLLATPLTAAVLVLVKMLYIEDALGDPVGS